jgi:hypothetical protein
MRFLWRQASDFCQKIQKYLLGSVKSCLVFWFFDVVAAIFYFHHLHSLTRKYARHAPLRVVSRGIKSVAPCERSTNQGGIPSTRLGSRLASLCQKNKISEDEKSRVCLRDGLVRLMVQPTSLRWTSALHTQDTSDMHTPSRCHFRWLSSPARDRRPERGRGSCSPLNSFFTFIFAYLLHPSSFLAAFNNEFFFFFFFLVPTERRRLQNRRTRGAGGRASNASHLLLQTVQRYVSTKHNTLFTSHAVTVHPRWLSTPDARAALCLSLKLGTLHLFFKSRKTVTNH